MSKDQNYKKDYKGRSNHGKRGNSRNGKKGSSDYKKNNAPDYESRSYAGFANSENDASWYLGNPQLVHDASRIPFGNIQGAPVKTLENLYSAAPDPIDNEFAVPGVMSLTMMPTIGKATSVSDGVNIAGTALFQYIRKNLSTVANYAQADVTMYILGMDSLFTQYCNIARIFGIINAFSAGNLYYPKYILRAGYGFSDEEIDNIRNHYNDYRSAFNNLIYKASSLYLPTDFTITTRHGWLFSNYFTDSTAVKSQIFIHRLGLIYKFDEISYNTGTALKYQVPAVTLQGLLDQFDQSIEVYRNSDSMMRIAADMRRAFEDKIAWKMAFVDENYLLLPTYSAEVLAQIENTTILPSYDYIIPNTLEITQDVDHNYVVCDPRWNLSTLTDNEEKTRRAGAMLSRANILNVHKPEVTTEDIVVMTRDMVNFDLPDSDGDLPPIDLLKNVGLSAFGVDLCIGCAIYSTKNCFDGGSSRQELKGYSVGSASDLLAAINVEMFDWHPPVRFAANNGDQFYFQDLDNYAEVPKQTLKRLHENIIMSMWSIPTLGMYTGQN